MQIVLYIDNLETNNVLSFIKEVIFFIGILSWLASKKVTTPTIVQFYQAIVIHRIRDIKLPQDLVTNPVRAVSRYGFNQYFPLHIIASLNEVIRRHRLLLNLPLARSRGQLPNRHGIRRVKLA